MDAIKKFVEDHDGDVELILGEPSADGRFVPFKVKITLPPPHFAFIEEYGDEG